MLIKVCADSIVIREGGGSIFLRERQGLGGASGEEGRAPHPPPPSDPGPLLGSRLLQASLASVSHLSLSEFFSGSLDLPVSLPSCHCVGVCLRVSASLCLCLLLSLVGTLSPQVAPTHLPLIWRLRPSLCVPWGYVFIRVYVCTGIPEFRGVGRGTCVFGCV